MRQYPGKEHIYAAATNSRARQEEIADVFNDTSEYMKRATVEKLTTLAKYYYGTDKVVRYAKYIPNKIQKKNDIQEEEDEELKYPEYLYTLIQYEGEDILLHIGTGEFAPEVFLRRDVPELTGLSHSPLPLFVVEAREIKQYPWAEKEEKYKHTIVRKFLNETATIYSPKGGEVEIRNIKNQAQSDIKHGNSNGIINYKDAMLVLENAIIDAISKDIDNKAIDREKILKEMEQLQSFSREEFVRWTKLHHNSYTDTQKHIFGILKDIVEKTYNDDESREEKDRENELSKNMYSVVKMFDVKKLSTK